MEFEEGYVTTEEAWEGMQIHQQMVNQPLVSFITLNWNGSDDTLRLVQSIRISCRNTPHEIIVVENGSMQEERQKLLKFIARGDFNILYSDCNMGFCKGNNEGAKVARGQYLCFINNDTQIISNKFIENMLFPLQYARASLTSPTVVYENTSRVIFSGANDLTWYGAFIDRQSGICLEDINMQPAFKWMDWYTGTCYMVEKAEYLNMGGLREELFIFCDEADYAMRLKKANKKMAYVPGAVIAHKLGAAMKKNNAGFMENKLSVRNKYLIFLRNKGTLQTLIRMPVFLAYDIYICIRYKKTRAFISGFGEFMVKAWQR
jgi:GT2 family glycosyltransferase